MQSTILPVAATHVIQLSRGDKLLESLQQYAQQHNITAAHFQGIGALAQAHVSYFDIATSTYLPTTLHEVELISCQGNIARHQDTHATIVHAHICVSDQQGRSFAGHLNADTTVSVTAEIFLTTLAGTLWRSHDPTTTLHLLNLHHPTP